MNSKGSAMGRLDVSLVLGCLVFALGNVSQAYAAWGDGRPKNSDRPTVTDEATTVEPGHSVIETTAVGYSKVQAYGGDVTVISLMDSSFRIGLGDSSELGLSVSPLARASAGSHSEFVAFYGFGGRLKINLGGNDDTEGSATGLVMGMHLIGSDTLCDRGCDTTQYIGLVTKARTQSSSISLQGVVSRFNPRGIWGDDGALAVRGSAAFAVDMSESLGFFLEGVGAVASLGDANFINAAFNTGFVIKANPQLQLDLSAGILLPDLDPDHAIISLNLGFARWI